MRMTYLMLMLVLAVALGFGQQSQPEFLKKQAFFVLQRYYERVAERWRAPSWSP